MNIDRAEISRIKRKRERYTGCGFWVLFSFLMVFIRGVSWDETYEHALAITRIAPYPLDHPFYIYTRNIYSFQSYLSAGILLLTKSELLVCTYRDILLLLSLTVPLFLFTTHLSKRAIWGHVAVVLSLCYAYTFFASHYGIGGWPGFFSVGPIGANYALLVFAAFICQWTRTAWFLLTSLIAVHLGQLPPLLIFAAIWLIWGDADHRKKEFRAAWIWGGAGFAFSLLFLMIQRQFAVPYPTEGAYFSDGNAAQIWIDYSTRQDVHRFIEYVHPFQHSIVLIGLVIVLAALGMSTSKLARTIRSPYACILIYALIVGTISIGIHTVHGILGDDIPFLLIGWMPYRIPNHLAPILLCMSLATIAQGIGHTSQKTTTPLWAILVLLMAWPIALNGYGIPETIYQAYIEEGEYMAFALFGGALGVLAIQLKAESKLYYFFIAIICTASLIIVELSNVYALACVIGGIGVTWGFSYLSLQENKVTRASLAMLAVLITSLFIREWNTREHLPRTPFQQGVVDYLAQAGDSKTTIISPDWEVEWGARTGAPIFTDYQTPRLITYIPALAPSLKKMHQDVYGYSIDGSPEEDLKKRTEISRERWIELGRGYEFRYLVAASDSPLHLDPVYSKDGMSLYKIPIKD